MEKVNIDKNIIELVNATKFDQAFFAELMNCDTNIEAYERIEEKYFSVFGKRKYSNYDSYRKCRDRRLKG